ncbi:MAG: hypothetical protein ABR913_09275 [Sedimentisphaerales bacterium]
MKRAERGHWIYRKSITTKRGKVLYAWQYGHRAFRIWVKAA